MSVITTKQLNKMRHEIIRAKNVIAMHEETLINFEKLKKIGGVKHV